MIKRASVQKFLLFERGTVYSPRAPEKLRDNQ